MAQPDSDEDEIFDNIMVLPMNSLTLGQKLLKIEGVKDIYKFK